MQTFKVILAGAILTTLIGSMASLTVAQESSDTPPASAAEPVEVVERNGDVKIKLNFQDAPLQAVLEYLSETAGLTVVSEEPLINGRMTVISRQPISLTEAVSLINSVLKERDLTTVLTGKTLKVVTLAKAKSENIPVLHGQDPDAVVASDEVVTYVVPVGHVTATALKDNLATLVPEYASLEANEDSNALIITDTKANIKRLMQIVRALDTHMSTVAEIRVFRLTNADATSAATLINNIFRQEQTSSGRNQRGGRGGPFEMMMRRGRGGDDDNDRGQAGGSVNVQVAAAADDRTNSVVVRGPAESLEIVASVITALDDDTARVADVRVFQLRYADAMNTADVINNLFGQNQSSQSQEGPRMFRGPFGRGRDDAQQEEGGGAVTVVAAADSQTNTVVVTGPSKILDVVAEVVERLDAQIPNTADVKVFHLEYADAQDTAELINEVFGESGTSSRSTRSRNQQNQRVQFMRGPGGFGAAQSSATSSDVQIIASADSRTNSVVVSGPPETLQIVAQVVKELDENPEQERRIFVYPLKNANAENLRDILNSLFAEIQALNQQSSGQTGQQFQGAQRGPTAQTAAATSSDSSDDLSEDTYFEADSDTNALLVMTSTKNYEKIKPILDEFD